MSVDGKWTTQMNTPMGAQNASMELHTDGNTLTGILNGPNGEAVEIQDGVINDNALSWKAAITSPMPITLEFSATLDGDEISGDVKLGAFGNATFTGQRA